ncbi:ribose-phosphate pyrophosphokinase [Protomyces lactucae-debilis]|uniref:ribose-phosphate diphosphokinase n=1 Tax=Protomyces lactucae-debilis TaxID=2754530 RepID=A0A1Y2F3A9_PROLT|nr:ribose-phosphate pyrophosphokinase [Protomyces lactucae-debilis]ORY77816.1 ribose-phosphate pyrophosphokinase [Protomyces lactucae-debilis]
MRGCVVLGTNGHPELTKAICNRLGMQPGEVDIKKFSNGETSVKIYNSVRGQDVYIVSPGSGHVNDNLMEMLIMISACKTASANKVTAVLPVFPYSRQPDVPYSKVESPKSDSSASFIPDKFTPNASGYRKWVAQAGTLVAALLTTAGADHIITMDLHDPQFQGFFDIPVDNLFGRPLLQRFITLNIPNHQNAVVVSPDAGGAKRATAIADSLEMDFALIHKDRRNKNQHDENQMMLVGDVQGKVAILIDDLVDTGNTLCRAAQLLHHSGATSIYALVTHALLSGDAIARLRESKIDVLVVTNTSPQEEHASNGSGKMVVIDVAPVFAEAIRRIHNGESVSLLFDHGI